MFMGPFHSSTSESLGDSGYNHYRYHSRFVHKLASDEHLIIKGSKHTIRTIKHSKRFDFR